MSAQATPLFSCSICYGEKINCYKCQIRLLTRANNDLTEALNFILGDTSRQLEIKQKDRMRIERYWERSDQFNPHYDCSESGHWQFVTITFDPARFGDHNRPKDEKNYILHALTTLRKHYTRCYGCFEYTKNGKIHSHLVVKLNLKDDFMLRLKELFTFNTRNKICIDFGDVRPNAIKYINKDTIKEDDRGDEWYRFNDGCHDHKYTEDNGLDYGLDPKVEAEPNPDKWVDMKEELDEYRMMTNLIASKNKKYNIIKSGEA